MPTFFKDDKTIYFAHIPKTAGTSIYRAFIISGWKIGNIRYSEAENSSYQKIKKEFGKDAIIEENSATYGYPHPIQHATYRIWRKWGDFDESFAIVRNPIDRFKSEIRYQYEISKYQQKMTLETHSNKILCRLRYRPDMFYRGFAGHLIPQHYFISPTTNANQELKVNLAR